MALHSLGLDGPAGGDERPLTVTGGLGFAGGPGNNYSTHAIAATVEACRADPGSIGLVTALGWYATKHSVGLYSSAPPAAGFVAVDPAVTQAVVDTLPRREPAGVVAGKVAVEATSVVFERDGTPSLALVSALTSDGRRALATTRDRAAMTAMCDEPWEGTTVALQNDGTANSLAV
jgi:acetyl-CoA C-acetyltransferase